MGWDFLYADNMPQFSLGEVEDEGEDYMEDGYGNFNNVGRNVEFKTHEKQAGFEGIENFNNLGGNLEFKTLEKEKQVGFDGIEEFKTPGKMPVSVAHQFMHSNTAPSI
ncbi:nitrate regulatory gene2 protein-like [Forsythia ovata]|uniref:Nitrate regulatory gene2 protein-like n=1 Tax=Forsythia ovata TaxID=205694 RepID=A0ABD1T9C4_9LAMI